MKHTTIVVTVGLALATALPTVSAQAQSAHTFVSPTGNDSNPGCSIAAPCRTFQAALAATTASGEIFCSRHGRLSAPLPSTRRSAS